MKYSGLMASRAIIDDTCNRSVVLETAFDSQIARVAIEVIKRGEAVADCLSNHQIAGLKFAVEKL